MQPTRAVVRRGILQAVAVGLLALGGWWVVAHGLQLRPAGHDQVDLRVYRGAVQWWLDGRPLYAFVRPHTSLGFTYPPFALLCLLPLGLGSETTAVVLISAVSATALLVTTAWLVAPVAHRHGRPAWLAVAVAVPVVALTEPVRETFGWGQVTLLLALLVLADVRALERGRPWAGVGIGLAAAIKVIPAFFVLYLVATRRWRPAAVAAGTALGATLLAWLLDPSASVTFWTRALWDTGRVGEPGVTTNQSLLAVLSRLADPRPADPVVWALAVVTVTAVGLRRAVRAARAGDELTGMTIAGLTATLISPISWTHHFYWVVPAAVVLLDVAAGTPPAAGVRSAAHPRAVAVAAGAGAAGVLAAYAGSLIWLFEGDTVTGRDGVAGAVGENAYALIALALLLVLPPRRLTRRPVGRHRGRVPSSAALSPNGPPRREASGPRAGADRVTESRGAGRRTVRSRPGGWSPR